MEKLQLGQILQQQGLVHPRQLAAALAYQRQWGGRLGKALMSLRIVTEAQLLAAVGSQLRLPVVTIGDRLIPAEILNLLPAKLIHQRRILPLQKIAQGRLFKLVVAFSAPEDLRVRDEVAFAAGMDVLPVLAGEHDIQMAIARNIDAPSIERFTAGGLDLPEEPEEPFELVFGRYVSQ
jgi:type IV pilus assembly protein PilB